MNRIIYIGMDVHSKTFSLCAMEPNLVTGNKYFAQSKFDATVENVVKYEKNLRKLLKDSNVEFVFGYEAGSLGFTLARKLQEKGLSCIILAPTTMKTEKGGVKVKTDARDAKNIAECLAFNTYKAVYIPSQEDEAVRDYIRMVDDLKGLKKKIQQQVNGLLLRHHYVYAKTKWTQSHLDWIQKLDLSPLDKETLNEYLSTYHAMCDKIERFTKRIVELSQGQRYQEIINRLICFLGITRERAIAICSEVGDFNRFAHPRSFTSFCGLTPTEKSSGETKRKGGITKAGNNHIRKELIEAAQSICRGKIGYKSKALKKRQENQSSTVIEYADKGNERLRRRYNRLICKGQSRNIVITAVARELAGFICKMAQGDFADSVTAFANNKQSDFEDDLQLPKISL